MSVRVCVCQIVRLSPAAVPELAALITPEASLETLVPLVDYLAAWILLPNVSRWVLHTVERGSGNGTSSRYSLKEGGHRGGSSSRK